MQLLRPYSPTVYAFCSGHHEQWSTMAGSSKKQKLNNKQTKTQWWILSSVADCLCLPFAYVVQIVTSSSHCHFKVAYENADLGQEVAQLMGRRMEQTMHQQCTWIRHSFKMIINEFLAKYLLFQSDPYSNATVHSSERMSPSTTTATTSTITIPTAWGCSYCRPVHQVWLPTPLTPAPPSSLCDGASQCRARTSHTAYFPKCRNSLTFW